MVLVTSRLCPLRDDPLGNRGDLGRRFAYAKDDFRESLSNGTVMIDPCEAEVLERQCPQKVEQALLCVGDLDRTATDLFEQLTDSRQVHFLFPGYLVTVAERYNAPLVSSRIARTL